jgi:hypothetical protein
MDKREALRSMLNNLINDKQAEAQLDLHSYLTDKMKEVSGLVPTVHHDADLESDATLDAVSDDLDDSTEA